MAAATPTQTPAPEGSGLGMDARLDQETAQWLRWDRVRADPRLPGSRAPRHVRQGAGPSFLPSLPHHTLAVVGLETAVWLARLLDRVEERGGEG